MTPTAEEKAQSWFYKKAQGGGSLLDYAGYGATIGTWFQGGRKPIEVTCMVDEPAGLEVDEHSVIVCRYGHGLSKIETRWGTFTDPWTHQPQPKCGFVICGTRGTICAYDYETTIRVQTTRRRSGMDWPVDDVHALSKTRSNTFWLISNRASRSPGRLRRRSRVSASRLSTAPCGVRTKSGPSNLPHDCARAPRVGNSRSPDAEW